MFFVLPRYDNEAVQAHSGFSAVCSFVQGALFLVSALLYLCGQHEYLGFLVTCLALSWVNLIYYSRGARHMGIYSVMIQKVVNTEDKLHHREHHSEQSHA